jgi:hypothetical protein
MIYFANGTLFGTPTGGNLAANPTPTKFGILQDVSVDFSGDSKELFGQNQFPVDSARGKIKIGWKAKFASVNGKMLNDLFFADVITTPMNLFAIDEAAAIPTTPFTISVANHTKWVADDGVINVSTGEQLVATTGAVGTGQYSVASGVYTFASADTGTAVIISYSYNAGTGVGNRISIVNHPMGYSPQFKMELTNNYQGKSLSLTLNACRANKLTFATKVDDYAIPEFDGTAFCDASGNVGFFDISD